MARDERVASVTAAMQPACPAVFVIPLSHLRDEMGVVEVALLALGVAVVDLLLLTASHPDHKPFCEQECAGPVGGGDTPTGPSSCQWGVDCGACARCITPVKQQ